MAGYGLAVEFKEYKDIECDIVFNDTSKAPSFDGSTDPKFPTTYNYFGVQETAEPIKNKYIYIFQKHSDGNAYLNREMKGTGSGKLDIYDIEDWENANSRDIKSKGFSRIYFDENSLKNGSMYYFCLSRIQWSKERLKVVRDQLKAGYCKRLRKLPIHSKYVSHYSDEEKKDVNYAIAEANSGYLLTEVFLFDYWKYIYSESDGLKKKLFDSIEGKEGMKEWLKGPEGSSVSRNELKALNDAIWHISSIGTKTFNFESIGMNFDLLGMHIEEYFKSLPGLMAEANYYGNYGSYGYIAGPAIAPSYFTENNLSYWRSNTYKAFREKVGNLQEKIDNYNVYHNQLMELDKDLDSDKLEELGEHPKGQKWTQAEYWMIKFSEEKIKKFAPIEKYSNLITNWISKKEFIAMQHDYAHGSEDEQGAQFEDFSTLLQLIVDTPAGRRYITKESSSCLSVLDKLNFDNDNEKHISDILAKDLSSEEITLEEQRELFNAIEKKNKESSYLATSFFTMRKMELGAFYALEALSVLGKPVKAYVEKTYFSTVIDDITMSFIKVKRGAVDGHLLCVKVANFETSPWWKKHKVKNQNDWLSYIKERYKLDSKNIELEVSGEYIFAKEVNIKYKLQTVTDFDEVIVKAEKFKVAKAIRKSEWLPRIVISFEVFNVMLAINSLATNKNTYDEVASILSLSGAIVDFAACVAEFSGKKGLTGSLGFVSGVIEAGMNYNLGLKKGAINDTFAENAYYCAAFGSLAVAIGSIVGIAFTGPGAVIVAIGIAVQVVSTLLATLFELDDIENWLKHSYWGKSANNLPCSIPSFSDSCYSDWEDNIPLQLKAYNYLAYGFNLDFRVWLDENMYDEDRVNGSIKVTIVPNMMLETSKLKVSVWLEDYRGAKEVLVDNKIIALDLNQLNAGGEDYIYPYVIKDINCRVKQIILTWYNPKFEFTENHGYWTLQQFVPGDRVFITDDFGKMIRDNRYIHIEASLDLYGNEALVLPEKGKTITLHRRLSDSCNNFSLGKAIGLSSKSCGEHERK